MSDKMKIIRDLCSRPMSAKTRCFWKDLSKEATFKLRLKNENESAICRAERSVYELFFCFLHLMTFWGPYRLSGRLPLPGLDHS